MYYDFITDEIKNSSNEVILKNSTNKKFIGIKRIILEVLRKGMISYNYAYHLGLYYLFKVPQIREVLQKRFPFVFVDEMQDMDEHQYDLLEKIFYDGGNSLSIFQRIGDKNQAIYNSVKVSDIWKDRKTILRLKGSQRLSKPIANVVKKFTLYNNESFDIIGLNECIIKPHILVFEDRTIEKVIPKFIQIIKENRLKVSNRNVKVICWNTEWKEDNASRQDPTKLRLEDYYKSFKKKRASQNKIMIVSKAIYYIMRKRIH